MKRERSSSANSSFPPSSPAEPQTPSPTPVKKIKASPNTDSSEKKPKQTSTRSPSQTNVDWTLGKREAFIDRIIAVGYKTADLDALAIEVRK